MTEEEKTASPVVPSFKEVYPRGYAFPGKRVKLTDVVDQEILIKEYVKRPSKFEEGREVVIVHAYNKQINPEAPHDLTFATGSKPVIQQLDATKAKLPYRAKVVKKKNYFSLE